jgi:hypothetical protein
MCYPELKQVSCHIASSSKPYSYEQRLGRHRASSTYPQEPFMCVSPRNSWLTPGSALSRPDEDWSGSAGALAPPASRPRGLRRRSSATLRRCAPFVAPGCPPRLPALSRGAGQTIRRPPPLSTKPIKSTRVPRRGYASGTSARRGNGALSTRRSSTPPDAKNYKDLHPPRYIASGTSAPSGAVCSSGSRSGGPHPGIASMNR